MKKTLLKFLLVSMTFQAYGQKTFIKTYGGNEGDYGNSSIIDRDSNIYVYGDTYSLLPTRTSSYLINTKFNGDTIFTKYFPHLSSNRNGCRIQEYNDTSLILAGYIDGGEGVYLHMINKDSRTIWYRKYITGFNISMSSLTKTNDNEFLLTGQIWGPPSYGFILKVNDLGDSLWIKKYETLGFLSLNQTKGNNYILSGRIIKEDYSEKYGLIKLNQNGDTLWTKTYYTNNNARVKYAFETIDSSIILTGGYYLPSNRSTGFLIKTKQNGDTIWTKLYHQDEIDDCITKVVENKDSSMIFVSNIIINEGYGTYIRLTKINSLGDTVWNRNFDDFDCFANDLILTPDSGYLITGYYSDNPDRNNSDDVLLIKTDKDGKVSALIPTFANTIKKEKITVCYPNPVTDLLNIGIDVQNVKLIDMNGEIWINTAKTPIDVSGFSEGIYFIIATDKSNKKYFEKIIIK
ncbi:MAG: T9SS type A sorting domain-containing protein [Bacteroidales bacterium]|jgi:hypothetical protein|nr:T9SS type A sorting domain-containing protein [Bacteroidales bacterium]